MVGQFLILATDKTPEVMGFGGGSGRSSAFVVLVVQQPIYVAGTTDELQDLIKAS